MFLSVLLCSVLLILPVAERTVLAAQENGGAPSFEGRTITMILGTRPGGRRDRIARVLAEYLGKYLPGKPTILVQNIPGGKGVPAMLKFSAGKPDGSVVGLVVTSDMEAPYFGAPGADYDPRKFVWVGSVEVGKQRNVLFIHRRTGIENLDDLKQREVALGSQGVGHRSYLYGRLIEEVLGLEINWVIGYSTPELYLALDKGEIDGRVNDSASMQRDRPDWIEKKEVIPLVAITKPEFLPPLDDPLFADVPSLMQFTKDKTHLNIIRKMNATGLLGAGVALPPGTPADIQMAFEKALHAAGEDPDFRKAWEKALGRDYEGVISSKEVVEAVRDYTDWPPAVRAAYTRLGHKPPK